MGERWKPNAIQGELLERMFMSGPIRDAELTVQQRAALKHRNMRPLVHEGDDKTDWGLTFEGNYFMGADLKDIADDR